MKMHLKMLDAGKAAFVCEFIALIAYVWNEEMLESVI